MGFGGGGRRVKISLSNYSIIFPYQGILSKKNPTKKWYFDHNWGRGEGLGHFVVGTTQKYHFFYVAPYWVLRICQSKIIHGSIFMLTFCINIENIQDFVTFWKLTAIYWWKYLFFNSLQGTRNSQSSWKYHWFFPFNKHILTHSIFGCTFCIFIQNVQVFGTYRKLTDIYWIY